MSLIIRLRGEKSDYFIDQTTTGINEMLKTIGILNYKFTAKNIQNDIVLPWVKLSRTSINYLKNVFLELEYNPHWTPESGSLFIGESMFFFDLAKEIFGEKKSHFVWNRHLGNCYVPVEFQNIYVPDEFLRNLGSSINLCNELKELANKLKLDLGDYTPDFELLYEQRVCEFENDILGNEKMFILYLYNFCLASIKYDLLIDLF